MELILKVGPGQKANSDTHYSWPDESLSITEKGWRGGGGVYKAVKEICSRCPKSGKEAQV